MNPIYLYLLTPILGLLRNYVKYKLPNFKIFVRTPIVYFILHSILFLTRSTNIVLKTLIYERWFWFFYKTFRSIKKNDYQVKKKKYIEKYNLKYNN